MITIFVLWLCIVAFIVIIVFASRLSKDLSKAIQTFQFQDLIRLALKLGLMSLGLLVVTEIGVAMLIKILVSL